MLNEVVEAPAGGKKVDVFVVFFSNFSGVTGVIGTDRWDRETDGLGWVPDPTSTMAGRRVYFNAVKKVKWVSLLFELNLKSANRILFRYVYLSTQSKPKFQPTCKNTLIYGEVGFYCQPRLNPIVCN